MGMPQRVSCEIARRLRDGSQIPIPVPALGPGDRLQGLPGLDLSSEHFDQLMPAGADALRPERDGRVAGYEGADEMFRRYGDLMSVITFRPLARRRNP